MQYDSATEFTETFKAMSFSQPLADKIAESEKYGILVPVATSYRGEILIVSSPSKTKERSGMAICKVTLSSCKNVKGKGFLWEFINPRKVIEMPCQKAGMKGRIWDCHYTKGQIQEYPEVSLRGVMNLPSFFDREK